MNKNEFFEKLKSQNIPHNEIVRKWRIQEEILYLPPIWTTVGIANEDNSYVNIDYVETEYFE